MTVAVIFAIFWSLGWRENLRPIVLGDVTLNSMLQSREELLAKKRARAKAWRAANLEESKKKGNYIHEYS